MLKFTASFICVSSALLDLKSVLSSGICSLLIKGPNIMSIPGKYTHHYSSAQWPLNYWLSSRRSMNHCSCPPQGGDTDRAEGMVRREGEESAPRIVKC